MQYSIKWGLYSLPISFLSTLSTGYRYLKTWPMVKQLGYYFPEYRVICAMKIAIPLMPLLAIVAVSSQVMTYGAQFLPQAFTIALFFISLPLQGLFWLGWRAKHPLPLTLLDWCRELHEQLNKNGIPSKPLGASACYLDMAQLLKAAFTRLEKSYWDKL